MNRMLWFVRALALLAVCAVATPALFALDMPNPKPKKEKKKKDDTSDQSNNASTDKPAANDQTATDKPAQPDSKPAAQDAPPPAIPAQTVELKFPKSTWETSFANTLKVGDWVESESPLAPGVKTRLECVEVGDHYTVTVSKTIMAGQTMEQKVKTIYSEADPDAKEVEKQRAEQKIETKEADDTVTIKDKKVAARRYETYQNGKLMAKAWISKEVPLGSAIKAEDGDGKVVTQITDFGRGK